MFIIRHSQKIFPTVLLKEKESEQALPQRRLKYGQQANKKLLLEISREMEIKVTMKCQQTSEDNLYLIVQEQYMLPVPVIWF